MCCHPQEHLLFAQWEIMQIDQTIILAFCIELKASRSLPTDAASHFARCAYSKYRVLPSGWCRTFWLSGLICLLEAVQVCSLWMLGQSCRFRLLVLLWAMHEVQTKNDCSPFGLVLWILNPKRICVHLYSLNVSEGWQILVLIDFIFEITGVTAYGWAADMLT